MGLWYFEDIFLFRVGVWVFLGVIGSFVLDRMFLVCWVSFDRVVWRCGLSEGGRVWVWVWDLFSLMFFYFILFICILWCEEWMWLRVDVDVVVRVVIKLEEFIELFFEFCGFVWCLWNLLVCCSVVFFVLMYFWRVCFSC